MTNLCIALYCILLFWVVLNCIVLLIYCYVDIIQYNVMHKFVGVLDNPRKSQLAGLFWLIHYLSHNVHVHYYPAHLLEFHPAEWSNPTETSIGFTASRSIKTEVKHQPGGPLSSKAKCACYMYLYLLGRVVRKLFNANPGWNVNRNMIFFLFKKGINGFNF